jgi:hypothetical protein
MVMGLDMYSKRVKSSDVIDELNFVDDGSEDIFYWRKNRHLHNWMTNLYLDKGGEQEFNLVPVQLLDSDLVRLAEDIILGNLDDSSGFFFGTGDYDQERMDEDLSFVKMAREVLAEGDAVYYLAWY